MSVSALYNQRNRLSVLIAGIILSQQAVAQTGSQADEAAKLDTVVVKGHDQAVIGSEDLERLAPNDLQDLFRGTPGVQVGSSLPISQKVYVNGIEETNLSVTIDGARQNNKLFHHAGTNLIDPQLLKAVRVDAGVAPADAGPGALGGSIAYETKDASDLLEPNDNFGGSVGLEYSSNGDTFSRDVSLFGRADGLELLAYMKAATGDEFEDGEGNEVFGSEAALDSGLFKVGYLADNGYRTKLSYEKVKDDADRPFRANFLATGPGLTATQTYVLDRSTVVLAIENTAPEGLINPYVQIARTKTTLETGPVNAAEYTSVNGKAANKFVLDSGTVDAGIDFYHDTSIGDFPDTSDDVEEKSDNIGVFAQARINVNEDTRLSFGGRYDNHELTGTDANNTKSDNDGFSGNISGEFDVTQHVTVSAGYSNVFGGVQLAEPYIGNPNWTYPISGLKSSEADNAFAGLEVNGEAFSNDLSGLTLGLRIFKSDIDDIRDEHYSRGPDLYSELESDGFEISARYDWQDGFFKFSYADIESEINGVTGSTEYQYIGVPVGKNVKAEFEHSLPKFNVTVGADAQHYLSLDGYDIYTDTTVSDSFESYTVANAFLSYKPASFNGLTLRASVENMFDESYVDRASYGQEYTSLYGTQVLKEQGRSFVLSAKLNF